MLRGTTQFILKIDPAASGGESGKTEHVESRASVKCLLGLELVRLEPVVRNVDVDRMVPVEIARRDSARPEVGARSFEEFAGRLYVLSRISSDEAALIAADLGIAVGRGHVEVVDALVERLMNAGGSLVLIELRQGQTREGNDRHLRAGPPQNAPWQPGHLVLPA